MRIVAENLGKRFNFNWIFRNLNFTFQSGNAYAIIGPNGSGKSTLLQILSASTLYSEGTLKYSLENMDIPPDKIFRQVVLAAPYLELVEEFTLLEQLHFHFQFKKLKPGLNLSELPEKLWLEKALHKEIKYFSSGMKQRLKLGLAFFSDTPILLLDEPTSNLDRTGIDWYKENIHLQKNRLVIIGSNQEEEYEIAVDSIKMGN